MALSLASGISPSEIDALPEVAVEELHRALRRRSRNR